MPVFVHFTVKTHYKATLFLGICTQQTDIRSPQDALRHPTRENMLYIMDVSNNMIKVCQAKQTSDVISTQVVLSQYIKVLMVADRYSLSYLYLIPPSQVPCTSSVIHFACIGVTFPRLVTQKRWRGQSRYRT